MLPIRRPPGSELVDYLIARLRETQIGTRPPAQQGPPYKSHPICWTQYQNAPPANPDGTFNVRWNVEPDSSFAGNPLSNASSMAAGVVTEPEPFPDGYIGVVFAECGAGAIANGAASARNVWNEARWSLLHNGAMVPGFQFQRCSSLFGDGGDTAGPSPFNVGTLRVRTHCPILLRSGHRMQVRFHWAHLGAGADMAYCALIEGYAFPEELVSPEIESLLTD